MSTLYRQHLRVHHRGITRDGFIVMKALKTQASADQKKYDVDLHSISSSFIWPLCSKSVKTVQLDEAVTCFFLTISRKVIAEYDAKWSQLYVWDCCFTIKALIMSLIVTWMSVICAKHLQEVTGFSSKFLLCCLFLFQTCSFRHDLNVVF